MIYFGSVSEVWFIEEWLLCAWAEHCGCGMCVEVSSFLFRRQEAKKWGYTEESGQNIVKAHTSSNPLLTKAPSTYHYFPIASPLTFTMCEKELQDKQRNPL